MCLRFERRVCAGDDQTDESMFDIEAPNLISIKVGPEPSRAKYRLRDPATFRNFLTATLTRDSERGAAEPRNPVARS